MRRQTAPFPSDAPTVLIIARGLVIERRITRLAITYLTNPSDQVSQTACGFQERHRLAAMPDDPRTQ